MEGWKKPLPTPYLCPVQPVPAAPPWYRVPSPAVTATKVGPGCVCHPVCPPGLIVTCWKAVSQGLVALQAINVLTDLTLTLTRLVTFSPRTRNLTLRVTVF